MARLTGKSIEIVASPIETATEFARDMGIIVFKGAVSIVAHPEGNIYLNSSGNAGMGTEVAVMCLMIDSFNDSPGLFTHDSGLWMLYSWQSWRLCQG